MKKYLEAVTLGAFTWRDATRLERLCSLYRELGVPFLVLQFLVIAVALNFPVMLIIAGLPPYELYSRLFGDNLIAMLPAEAAEALAGTGELNQGVIDDFNYLMLQNEYGKRVMLPLTGMAFALIVILQGAFYLLTVFFLGLSRMNVTVMSFRDRLGLVLFSSTLPAFFAALLGFLVPTVHLIVFYFIVIFICFQRSKLCPNG
jgi:hypothetical protein